MFYNCCPVCKNESIGKKTYKVGNSAEYSQCLQCGSIYQSSEIAPIEDYYQDMDFPEISENQKRLFLKYFEIIISNIKKNVSRCIFVDLGCGNGVFLNTLKENCGNRYIGVETSRIAFDRLKEDNFEIYNDLIEIPNITMPVILTMFQVIEHIHDPDSFLREVKDKLPSLRYLILTTPCVDSIFLKLYNSKWPSFSPNHHVVLYSLKSIEQMLNKHNFKIVTKMMIISRSNAFLFPVMYAFMWDIASSAFKFGNNIFRKKRYGVPGIIPPVYKNSMMVVSELCK